jgi:uncharacterized surface protein with fasciclin (FAS1) repeats
MVTLVVIERELYARRQIVETISTALRTSNQRSTASGSIRCGNERVRPSDNPAAFIDQTERNMNKRFAIVSAAAFGALMATASFIAPVTAREHTVMVGGAAMYPSKTIVDNAVHSRDHTTLVAAVKAAGLVDTLEGAGPFTVFAPTNAAFGKLPKGTVQTLVKPENKPMLTKILTYHVVPGRLEASDLTDGRMLTTVEGEQLTVRNAGGRISIVDSKGGVSRVTIPNVNQSNGVIHVVNSVLMPG